MRENCTSRLIERTEAGPHSSTSSDSTQHLSQPRGHPPTGMHDGLSQGAVAGTYLKHMENGRVAEEVPHLFHLAYDQGPEHRVTRGRGPEVGADPGAPGSVKASMGRVQTGLHELGECNAPMLVNESSDLLVNR